MAGLNHSLPVKLDPNNFLLWKMQMENVIIAHGIEGFIDRTNQCPSQFLSLEEKTTLNPLYTTWIRQDKMLLSWIYSTIFLIAISDPIFVLVYLFACLSESGDSSA